jgi:hypothetical protein
MVGREAVVKDAGDTKPGAAGTDEPFLERWSRRKQQAREGIQDDPPEPGDEPVPAAGTPQAGAAEVPELPDIDSLGEDSDYSAFMAPGVDASLRRQALRKLFSSPKFNVCDGLDDYCGDWRSWNELGDIVTADMRYHLERAAKLAEQLGEAAGPSQEREQVAEAAAAAPTAAATPAADGTEEPPTDDTERDA